DMDQKYKTAYDWLESGLSRTDQPLAQALVNEMISLGSAGSLQALTNWALPIVNGNFAAYPGVSANAQSTFEQITQAFPPDPFPAIKTDIQNYLANLQH